MIKNVTRCKKGFTLIELLVVIAIIAILASILFPVFARARENARRASCMSNLKQMGLAMMQYTQDYDECYPYSYSSGMGANPPGGSWLGTTSGDTYPTWGWSQLLYPYHKSLQILLCPSGVSSGSPDYTKTPIRGQYGANSLFLVSPPSATSPNKQPVKLSQLQAPANLYAIMDAGQYYMSYQYAEPAYSGAQAGYGDYLPGIGALGNACNTVSASYTNLAADCQSGRHFGGVNVVFADGHVKWLQDSVVSAEALKAAPNSEGAWNPANS